MLRLTAVTLTCLLTACGGEAQPPAASPPAPAASASSASPATPRGLEISAELRRQVPPPGACASGDACGFFVPILSPGSDAKALATAAAKRVGDKCAGLLIVYRDARQVMGAGVVVPTAEAKRGCEQALGRPADTDFPRAMIFRVQP